MRCAHCGERNWRTPVELKGGRLFCFMCAGVSAISPEAGVGKAEREPFTSHASMVVEVARRLAGLPTDAAVPATPSMPVTARADAS